jgi:uncharacterized protein YlxW (UPF0749 family)
MSTAKISQRSKIKRDIVILQVLAVIFLIGALVATVLALNEKQQLTAAHKATQNWQNKYADAKANYDFEISVANDLRNQISSLQQQPTIVQSAPAYNGPSSQEYCQQMENLRAAISNSAGNLSIAGTCY